MVLPAVDTVPSMLAVPPCTTSMIWPVTVPPAFTFKDGAGHHVEAIGHPVAGDQGRAAVHVQCAEEIDVAGLDRCPGEGNVQRRVGGHRHGKAGSSVKDQLPTSASAPWLTDKVSYANVAPAFTRDHVFGPFFTRCSKLMKTSGLTLARLTVPV